MIVDSAVYRDGQRLPDISAFDELFAACRSGEAMAWIGLYEPTHEELGSVAEAFHLHELAVEDAVFAPTLSGTVYGMNFEHMPELKWRLGYPMATALMLAVSLVLYAIFKRRRWI